MVMSEKSWTALAFEHGSRGMNVVSRIVSAPHDTGPAFTSIARGLPASWFLVAIVPGSHEITCPNIIKVALSEDRTDLMFGYAENNEEESKGE
jgi:hypothetical protein